MCKECKWEKELSHMEEVFGFCNRKQESFLEKIYSWVEENKHITEKQIRVIENIEEDNEGGYYD